MTSTGPTGLRAVRAGVFGTSVLLLAALAHLAAGGLLPSPSILLATGVPVGCAAVVLARRTRRLPTLLASLAAAQVVLHEAFMSTSSMACAPAGGMAGMHHATVACDAMPATTGAHALPSALMIALHVVATVATALLLGHGEQVLARVLTWARTLLAPSVAAAAPALRRHPSFVRAAAPFAPLRSATDVSRRGPPARPALVPVTA